MKTITANFPEIETMLLEINGASNNETGELVRSGFLVEELNLIYKYYLTEFSDKLLEKYESIRKLVKSSQETGKVTNEELNEIINEKFSFEFKALPMSILENIKSENNYPMLWKKGIFEESKSSE